MVSSTDRANEALIFFHIPKTGGRTLRSIINSQYRAEQIFTIGVTNPQETLDAFKQTPDSVRAQLRVLRGHMPFGLHAYLPQPSTYVSFLRDPVERAISYYYQIIRSPNHNHHAKVVSQNMDLEAFFRSGVSRIPDNGQVRMLAACEDVPFGEVTEDMRRQAQTNLERYFSVVGLTERFDESLVLLMRRFNWRVRGYTRRNVGENRLTRQDVPARAIQFITELNQYDRQLYAYAEKRLDATIGAAGAEFTRSFLSFRLSNRMRSHYVSLRKNLVSR